MEYPFYRAVKKELKYLVPALLAGMLLTGPTLCSGQEQLAEEVLRLHILAASDAAEDQALKIKVRDAVLAEFGAQAEKLDSRAAAEAWAVDHLEEIGALAESVLREEGCGLSVKTAVEDCAFPVKTYGALTLPAGRYRALRILIGEAKGKNWWCVLYPPLCCVDEALAENDDALQRLTEESRAIVCKKEPIARAKLKTAELWRRWVQKDANEVEA